MPRTLAAINREIDEFKPQAAVHRLSAAANRRPALPPRLPVAVPLNAMPTLTHSHAADLAAHPSRE
jgi:hypothetical protein